MNEIQSELVAQVAKFCQKHIEPFCEEDDREERFRLEIYQGLGELGLTGIPIPEEFGGAGLGYQELTLVLHEIAKYSVAYAVTLSVSTMCQGMILAFGTPTQKKDHLPALASGKEIAAFGLTESSSGSDPSSLKTTAKLDDKNYLLNGNKLFISSAGIAKTYLVMARTGGSGSKGISSFIIKDGTKGFSYGKKEKKMGWKSSPTRELVFQNCQVPQYHILGKPGEGLKIALSALDRGRITISSIANGLAERALEEAIKYSLQREQFGKSIFDFQGLQFMLAEMAAEVETNKILVESISKKYDRGDSISKLAAIAKLKATDGAMKVTTDAVQVFGGAGYTSDYPVERYMRDAKVLQIVEGTNQIQKVVIGRILKKEYS